MTATRGDSWLLYGAYGFTGELIAREAVERGHRPILAGRDGERTRTLAQELGLQTRVFELDDPIALREGVRGVSAVVHAAGVLDDGVLTGLTSTRRDPSPAPGTP